MRVDRHSIGCVTDNVVKYIILRYSFESCNKSSDIRNRVQNYILCIILYIAVDATRVKEFQVGTRILRVKVLENKTIYSVSLLEETCIKIFVVSNEQ